MHEANVIAFKDFSLSSCGHLALMQFRLELYHLACNQVSMQSASKIVEHFLTTTIQQHTVGH